MLTFNLDSFPEIHTARLILRQVKTTDVDSIFRLRNESVSGEFTARPPFESKKEALELIEKMADAYHNSNGISWAITQKGNDMMIGSTGFWRIERENYRAEIGYAILPEFENRGIMTEACLAIIKYGFDHLTIHSIEANIHPRNIASERILQKAGFVKEGYFKQNYYYNGRFDDTATYGLIKSS